MGSSGRPSRAAARRGSDSGGSQAPPPEQAAGDTESTDAKVTQSASQGAQNTGSGSEARGLLPLDPKPLASVSRAVLRRTRKGALQRDADSAQTPNGEEAGTDIGADEEGTEEEAPSTSQEARAEKQQPPLPGVSEGALRRSSRALAQRSLAPEAAASEDGDCTANAVEVNASPEASAGLDPAAGAERRRSRRAAARRSVEAPITEGTNTRERKGASKGRQPEEFGASDSEGAAEVPEPPIPDCAPPWLAELMGSKPASAVSKMPASFPVHGRDTLGSIVGAYNILRGFSWQLRLSPFPLDDLVAAISSPKPSPLLDEVHVCLLRAMYLDDLPEQRASRSKDPMLLDRITWPEFLWDYLHERGSLLVRLQCASVSGCPGESATLGFMEDQDPGEAVGPEPEGPWKRMRLPREEVDATPCRQVEYYSLPAATKAAVLQELCNGVLSSRVVKDELDARVEGKQWVAGRGGEGGAFPMFSEGMKAEKVEAEDGGIATKYNMDVCVLCGVGGGLLCCDGCPASYHIRCIGENSKNLPEGEWICPECTLGGRNETAGLRVPPMGCDLAGNPVWAAHGRLWGSLPGIAGICGSEDDATERQRVKETAPEQQPVMSSGRLGKHNHVAIESSTTDMSWDGDQDMRLVVIEGEPALDVAVAARNAGFLKAQMARKMMAKSMARGKGESSQRPRKAAKVQLARDTESGRGRQRKPRIDHGMLMDDDWEPSHDSDSDYSSGDERGRGREEEAADADVQISSLEMLAEPQPPPFQPQEYVNRYRNGWSALQAAKAVQLEEVRMGRLQTVGVGLPLPISKFAWSRRGCRGPWDSRGSEEQDWDVPGHLLVVVGCLMRMERDLLGLLEGSWACGDGKGASHRREWLQRTRQAKTPEEVKRSLLELEDAISWTAFLPEWRGATRGSSHRGYELDVPRSASERLPSALKSLPRERPVSAARTPAAADPNTIQSKTRCGKCYHCLRPHFKQKCLEPIIKYSDGRVEQGGILLEGSQGEWVEVRPKEQPKAKTDDSRAVEPAAKGENPGGQEAPGNPQAPPTSAGVHECPSQGPGTAAQPSSGQLSKPPRPEDASGILTVKRGPGRPRKSAVLENSATPAVKRGPGRPKKNPESPTPARVGEAHVSSVVSSFQKAREAMTGPQEVVDGLLAPAAVAAVAVSLFQMPSTPPTLQKPAAPLAPQLAFDPTAADGHLSTATLPQARVWSESNLSAESDMEGALVEPKSEQAGSNLLSSARGCGQELPAAEVEALGGAAELPNDQPTESTVAAERDGGASDEAPIEMQATLEAGKERPGKGENLAAEFPGAQQHVDPPEAPVVSSATPEGDQLKGEDDERNTLKSSVAMVEKQLGGQTPVRGDGEPQGDAAGPADAQVTPAAQVAEPPGSPQPDYSQMTDEELKEILPPPRMSPEPMGNPDAAFKIREKNRVRIWRWKRNLEKLRMGAPVGWVSSKQKRGQGAPKTPADASTVRRSGRADSGSRLAWLVEQEEKEGEDEEEDDNEEEEEEDDVDMDEGPLDIGELLPDYFGSSRRGGVWWREKEPPQRIGWAVHRDCWSRASGAFALPAALTRKLARQGGAAPINGITYRKLHRGRMLQRAPMLAWRAAVDAASTISQLALTIRQLDTYILWEDVRRPSSDKEPNHPLFKVRIEDKRESERGFGYDYLLLVDLPPATAGKAAAAPAAHVKPTPNPTAGLFLTPAPMPNQPPLEVGASLPLPWAVPSAPAAPSLSTPSSAPAAGEGFPHLWGLGAPGVPGAAVAATAPSIPSLQVSGNFPVGIPSMATGAVSVPWPGLLAQAPGSAGTPWPVGNPGEDAVQGAAAAAADVLETPAAVPVSGAAVPAQDDLKQQPATRADSKPEGTETKQKMFTYTPRGPRGYTLRIPYGVPTWVPQHRLPLWMIKGYEEDVRRKDQKALYDHMQIEKQLAQTNSPGESAMPGGQEAVPASYSCQACKRPWTEEEMDEYWIGCDRCDKWFHGKCVQATCENLEDEECWECPSCMEDKMQRRAEALAKLRAQRLAAGHIPKALRVQQGVKSGRRPGTKGKGRGRHRGGSAGEDLVEDDLEDGEEEEQEGPEMYCVCQSTDADGFYVGCDGCNGWFHPECIGLTMEEVDEMDDFLCPLCARKAAKQAKRNGQAEAQEKPETSQEPAAARAGPSPKRPNWVTAKQAVRSTWGEEEGATGRVRSKQDWSFLTGSGHRSAPDKNVSPPDLELTGEDDKRLQEELRKASRAVGAIIKLKCAAAFLDPVPLDTPFYHEIVEQPMDLGTISTQLKEGGYYQSAFQVLQDVRLVWANCREYNAEESEIIKAAASAESAFELQWAKSGLPQAEDQAVLRQQRLQEQMAEGRARASPKEELPEEALQAFGPPPTWGSKRKRRTDESRRSHAAATGAPGSSKKPKAEQDGEEGEAGPRQGIRVVLPARETPASSTGGKTELSKATALAEQRLGGPAPDGAKKRMGRDGREDTKGRRSLKGQQVGSVEPDDVESKGGNFTGGEEVADRNAGSKQPPAAVLDKPQVGSGASRGPKSPKDEDEPRASHQKAPGTRKLEGEEATEGDAGDTNAATRPILNVGDLVEANRGSKGEFHPGKVIRVARDGALTIVYHKDGRQERSVPPSLVRPDPRAVVGAAVECYWDGDDVYYPGRVAAVHSESLTADIDYDDGESEQGFPLSLMRLLPTAAIPKVKIKSASKPIPKVTIRAVQGGKKAGPEPRSSSDAAAANRSKRRRS